MFHTGMPYYQERGLMSDIVKRNPHNLTPQFDGSLIMEGAQVVYRNFEGRETPFNREGDRNFAVVLDDVTAEEMRKDGWNVKTKPSKDDPDQNFNTLSVKIGNKGKPPNIVMISRRGRTKLSVNEVEVLDWVEFQNVDLKVGPYHWNVRGESGITAYLRALYITVLEDDLDKKYADIPDVGMPAIERPDDMPDGPIIAGELID
jgi:hypothetical protein